MCRISRIVFPKSKLPLRSCFCKIDNSLIGRSFKPESNVMLILFEWAIHQNINERQNLLGFLAAASRSRIKQVLIKLACIAPDGFFGKATSHPLKKRQQTCLVLRLHWLASKKRQAINVRGIQALDDFIFNLACEWFSRREIPCF